MTEFILQTDPLEFQNSRQSTKIMFLQQEVHQLQDHIKDLENIVRINKEVLKIATGPQGQASTKSQAVGSQNDNTNNTIDTSSNSLSYKSLQNLVEHLQEENSRLLDIIEKVKKERNIAQSKALISEQICEEAQRHELETVAELEEKISDLRKLLQDKEYAIQELEKIKAIPEQEGVVVKFREVLNPTEQNLKLHNEIDALNGMLAKVSKELNKLQAENQQLQTINFSLTNELAKIKATFSSPLNFPHRFGILGQMNGETDLNNSDFLAGVFQPGPGLDENSPLPSPLPDKVHNTDNQSKAPVPKLDLSKAKKIQEQIAKKITQPQIQPTNENLNPKYLNKINQLEDELTLAKKRLSHEMINNRLLSDEISSIHRQVVQLSSANEILIKSNKRYEEKWQKIFYTLEFYREFYHKYIDLITKGRTHIKTASTFTPKLENLVKIKEKFDIDLSANPDKLIRDFKRIEEENGNQINVSILQANDGEEERHSAGNEEKEKLKNFHEFSKEQCKIYLLNMARDLYVNTNLSKTAIAKQMLKKMVLQGGEQHQLLPTLKLKRSQSNPLEYVSERKQLIFETDLNKKGKKTSKKRQDKKDQEFIIDEDSVQFLEPEDKVKVSQNDKGFNDQSPTNLNNFENTKKGKPQEYEDEMISFTVDAEDFNKNKLVEVSFISNNDILDHIKQE